MSHPARAPRSGIDGKTNAAGGRDESGCSAEIPDEAAGMSHPARAPRSGIDGKTNAAGGRGESGCSAEVPDEAAGMSHPARAPRSGIDGKTNAAGGRGESGCSAEAPGEAAGMSHPARAPRSGNGGVFRRGMRAAAGFPQIAAAGVGSVVRPGRSRSRTKAELDEKIKKPAEGTRKKPPPSRKAPARGRYVDEYARPA